MRLATGSGDAEGVPRTYTPRQLAVVRRRPPLRRARGLGSVTELDVTTGTGQHERVQHVLVFTQWPDGQRAKPANLAPERDGDDKQECHEGPESKGEIIHVSSVERAIHVPCHKAQKSGGSLRTMMRFD